jgi:Ca2+-dependent lipid-binding protein
MLPCFKSLTFCFLEAPYVDLELKLLGGDFLAVLGNRRLMQETVNKACVEQV